MWVLPCKIVNIFLSISLNLGAGIAVGSVFSSD